MKKKKQKKYVDPEAVIVEFVSNDIITLSDNESEGFNKDGYREGWWG